ncbi:MAG TPA: hypothetical protein VM935_17005 [Chitinophagaceae bacterium]|nr:hypothetical protein [Chitinophagaceae bacterium]
MLSLIGIANEKGQKSGGRNENERWNKRSMYIHHYDDVSEDGRLRRG